MPPASQPKSFFTRPAWLPSLRALPRLVVWTRASGWLLSAFIFTIALIIYIWWPLAEEYLAQIDWTGPWWRYIDWLLINIFLVMSVLIVSRANLRRDSLTVFIGLAGGLVIESWGTQTELWTYYTLERPPLWIIPAWPIASLAIDRLVQALDFLVPKAQTGKSSRRTHRQMLFSVLYCLTFAGFYALMLVFVAPTLGKSLTLLSLLLCAGLILTPTDARLALLTFTAGAGLGYFLELWGTTRLCWTYYTLQTPPLFAVLAHGMAAVAFWRARLLFQSVWRQRRRSRSLALSPPA